MVAERILVTGANGFIGANVVRHFVREDHEVHAFVRTPENIWRLKGVAGARVHAVDLVDGAAVRTVVARVQPTVVMHLAAHAALPDERDEAAVFTHTILPLVHLVAAVRGLPNLRAVINAGSSSEYGFQEVPMREDLLPNPTSAHGVAKHAQTLYGQYAARFFGLPLVTLRFFGVYGPFEQPRRLIPRLMRAALVGTPINLSNPETKRDFIAVPDVIAAIEACLRDPTRHAGAVYNVGTGVQHSLAEVTTIVERICGKALPLRWGAKPPNKWDTPLWVADTTLAAERLGWRSKITFETGLEATYHWFAEHLRDYPAYLE